MIYGYARVSTPKQDIERQVRNILRKYTTAVIITVKHNLPGSPKRS